MASSDLSSKLNLARPILAALTALLVLEVAGVGLSGPMSSFALGLPLLALFAS
ncbi:MAG: hypothetical protein GXP62_21390, partial [Oligoflexia bacterium]|nr:hypothetical protein [Oligoflexia bacterium]